MKYTTAFFAAGAFIVAVSSIPIRRDVPANLIPAFGVTADTDPDGKPKLKISFKGSNECILPTGTGNCVGKEFELEVICWLADSPLDQESITS